MSENSRTSVQPRNKNALRAVLRPRRRQNFLINQRFFRRWAADYRHPGCILTPPMGRLWIPPSPDVLHSKTSLCFCVPSLYISSILTSCQAKVSSLSACFSDGLVGLFEWENLPYVSYREPGDLKLNGGRWNWNPVFA